MAKPRIMQTMPYDNLRTLVFCRKSLWNSAKQRWGRFISAIFDQYFAISQKLCNIGT